MENIKEIIIEIGVATIDVGGVGEVTLNEISLFLLISVVSGVILFLDVIKYLRLRLKLGAHLRNLFKNIVSKYFYFGNEL